MPRFSYEIENLDIDDAHYVGPVTMDCHWLTFDQPIDTNSHV